MAEWIIEIKDGKFPVGKWTELVRCKDCKYNLDGHCDNWSGWEVVANDDFCSRGERMDEVE